MSFYLPLQNFKKTIENVFRYKPKDNIFKTLCSYAVNYVHEVKKWPSNRQK